MLNKVSAWGNRFFCMTKTFSVSLSLRALVFLSIRELLAVRHVTRDHYMEMALDPLAITASREMLRCSRGFACCDTRDLSPRRGPVWRV